MKSLRHNGIYIPEIPRNDLAIIIDGKRKTLTQTQEQMAMAWAKKQGTPYIEDPVFKENFFKDFCSSLGIDYTETIDFSEFSTYIDQEKSKKEAMTKEEKKAGILERKKLSEERREKYGKAYVDGKEVEVANYIAEPSGIFMGRGLHPSRGRWKAGPQRCDIILNLSPDAEVPSGEWKEIIWKPKKMWIASWTDKLSGKTKYVWLADSWGKKQTKEKLKFDRALEMGNVLGVVYDVILNGLNDKDDRVRKIASVCYLIYKTNMRVGDEKDPDEADTVGAITLRPEHVTIQTRTRAGLPDMYDVYLDFLGKDSIRWRKVITSADPRFIKNLDRFKKSDQAFFDGICSKDVSKFLRKAYPHATAKMFRTYRATKAMKDALRHPVREVFNHPELFNEKFKKIHIKFCIAEASRVCNHKKALPKNYEERLAKKKDKVDRYLEKQVEIATKQRKGNAEKVSEQLATAKLELIFFTQTTDLNLNTTLKSYVDPRIVKEACDKADLPYEKIYSKALVKKFSWCLK